VKSKEEAIEWAKRVPVPDGEGREYEIEIRQFLEMEDFAPSEAANHVADLGKELVKTQAQAQ
jgi:predicted component of type VI protein secretion system